MAKVITPKKAPVEDRLSWPQGPRDLSSRPRVFRMHRLDSYSWQAYVILDNTESPIGKPDLFDIIKNKVAGVMRAEGQLEFLANKNGPKDPNASKV